jgi:hypothetical protein
MELNHIPCGKKLAFNYKTYRLHLVTDMGFTSLLFHPIKINTINVALSTVNQNTIKSY